MKDADCAVVIEPLPEGDGGGFVARVLDLPGYMSDGDTRDEAARNIEDAIRCWVEEAMRSVARFRLQGQPCESRDRRPARPGASL